MGAWAQENRSRLQSEAAAATQAGNFQGAEQLYEQVVRSQPTSAEAWSNLGAVQVMAGDCQKAMPSLKRAREINANLFTPWYLSGVCESRRHRDQAALIEFKRAVAIDPKDANAWYMESQSADALGQVGPAFRAAIESLRLEPDRSDVVYQAGELALELASQCYARVIKAPLGSPYAYRLETERNISQEVWAQAVSSGRKAEAIEQQAPDIHFALGMAYLGSAQLSEAEAELRKSLTTATECNWTKIQLARTLVREHENSDALSIMNALQTKRLDDAEELADFIRVAAELGENSLACHTLQQGLQRFPRDAQLAEMNATLGKTSSGTPSVASNLKQLALFVRFEALADPPSGNWLAEAIGPDYKELRRAFFAEDLVDVARSIAQRIDPIPDSPKQAFALGEVMQWLGYHLEANLELRFPDSVAAQRLLAENLSAAGEQAKALTIYNQIIKSQGPSADIARDIARIYWTEHQWNEALKALQALVQMDPLDAGALVNMGRIYLYQHDLDNAEHTFERATQANSRLYEAHLGLGETLYRRGRAETALRELQTAARIQPQNPRPHYLLAEVYRRLGAPDRVAAEMADFQRLQARRQEGARQTRDLGPLD